MSIKDNDRKWNDDFLSLYQTKAIQVFCIIGVVFHHMAQKTCAPWLNAAYIIHGLDIFVNLGYLFVGVFLFSSGYGLYVSFKSKDNYLDGFLARRIGPVVYTALIASAFFYLYGSVSNPYSWYVYAIIYLYIAFYFIFKYIKNENVAIVTMGLAVVLYAYICDYLVKGTWWYNTIGMFFAGLLFAYYEKSIIAILKRYYWILLIFFIVIGCNSFFWANPLKGISLRSNEMVRHEIFRILAMFLEFMAALSFTMICLFVNLKLKFRKNVIFDFVSKITLEIYLIHGFFVQIFGFCFVNEQIKPVLYIRNIPLYVTVVLICGIGSAYLVYLSRKGLCILIKKYDHICSALFKDIKKIGIGLVIFIAGLSVILLIIDRVGEKEREAEVNKYSEQYIKYVDVNDKKMAAYVVGEGKDCIVLMRGLEDPCPTVTMRALADCLAKDYTVVVLDYFGSGFSDDADSERNINNIVLEIHTAVEQLKIAKPYILMPQTISGTYALSYVNQYPEEVKAIYSIETDTAQSLTRLLNSDNMSLIDYKRIRRKEAVGYGIAWRTIDFWGYMTNIWPLYEQIYVKGINKDERAVSSELLAARIYNRQTINEMKNEYLAYILTEDMKYPDGVQVVNLYSNYMRDNYLAYGIDADSYLKQKMSNPQLYKSEMIVDPMYCMCYKPETIRSIVNSTLQ